MFGLAFAMGGAQEEQQVEPARNGGVSADYSAGFHVCNLLFFTYSSAAEKGQEHKALLESMKKGDNVITAGGVHGKITAVDNELVTLEIANNVNIKITKSYIAAIKKD